MGDKGDKVKKDASTKNKELYADKSLFKDPWLTNWYKDIDICLTSVFCNCCVMGVNNAMIVEEGRCLNFFLGCCFGCCLCGLIRSDVQKYIGVEDDGCPWNCFMHAFICCAPCSTAQEYRSLVRFRKSTSSKFKDKYDKKKKIWGNSIKFMQGKMD